MVAKFAENIKFIKSGHSSNQDFKFRMLSRLSVTETALNNAHRTELGQ